jgi:adenosylcobinamide kinase/adenosylcobinamide-phosphate guanylyltransferase
MHPSGNPPVTLVLGGVRSGKSRWAQQLAARAGKVVYIATAQPSDAEMEEKIRRHRADRPSTWPTIEEPLELGRAIASCDADCGVILVDCLTIFTANLLHAEEQQPGSMPQRLDELYRALRNPRAPVILVSNEVGSGVVPAYELGRRYRDALGELNQRVAAIADRVVLMVAGLPLALKGGMEAFE